jgi:hypothetical protein
MLVEINRLLSDAADHDAVIDPMIYVHPPGIAPQNAEQRLAPAR